MIKIIKKNLNMSKKINKIKLEAGQIARILLALAVILLVAIVIAYFVVKRAEKKPTPLPPTGTEQPLPVYDTTIGDVKFVFLETTNLGNTLWGSNSREPDWQKDLKTTERFIELIVGGQNVGKQNTEEGIWDIGEIVDKDGRNFTPLEKDKVRNWLPEENLCGAVLKPSFEPTPCIKIYEVAKIAKDLKVRVFLYKKAYSDERGEESIIDIKLMP